MHLQAWEQDSYAAGVYTGNNELDWNWKADCIPQ